MLFRSSARDVTTLLAAALRNPFIRTWSTRSTATIAGGRTLTSTDRLIGTLPLVGAKTGHTSDAGWSQVAAVERNGVRITASLLGAATEEQRNKELASLLAWGLEQYRRVVVAGNHVYGRAEVGYGLAPVVLVAARQVPYTIWLTQCQARPSEISETGSSSTCRHGNIGSHASTPAEWENYSTSSMYEGGLTSRN